MTIQSSFISLSLITKSPLRVIFITCLSFLTVFSLVNLSQYSLPHHLYLNSFGKLPGPSSVNAMGIYYSSSYLTLLQHLTLLFNPFFFKTLSLWHLWHHTLLDFPTFSVCLFKLFEAGFKKFSSSSLSLLLPSLLNLLSLQNDLICAHRFCYQQSITNLISILDFSEIQTPGTNPRSLLEFLKGISN